MDHKPILNLLKDIEEGIVKITFVTTETSKNPEEVFAGGCKYRCDNGWEIVVFNDCDSWDYLNSALSPAGDFYDVWEDEKLTKQIGYNYRPPKKVIRDIYKIKEE